MSTKMAVITQEQLDKLEAERDVLSDSLGEMVQLFYDYVGETPREEIELLSKCEALAEHGVGEKYE